MNKIILIERYSKASSFWPNLERDNNLELTTEQIVYKNCQGFEGKLISYFGVSKNTNILKIAKALIEISYDKDKQNHLTLYISSSLDNNNDYLNEVAVKVGYDVGHCEDEGAFYGKTNNYSFGYSSYSSIHVIIFGKVEKLVVYKDFLNEYLLFSE